MLRSFSGFVLLMLVLAGCSSVTILQPLPTIPDAAERARLEGEWIMEGEIIYVRFGSRSTGQFAGVDWKEEQFQLDTGEIVVCGGAKQRYLSLRMRVKDQWEDHFFFAQYAFTDQGDLILWLPDPDAFDAAIQGARLEGTVERSEYTHSVVITSPPEKILAFLDDPANGNLFDTTAPKILKRLVLKPSHTEEDGAMEEK